VRRWLLLATGVLWAATATTAMAATDAATTSTGKAPPAPPPLSSAAKTEPPQTVVYWNARLALREGRPVDVLKLWLLRNAIEARETSRGAASVHDGDFRSTVWAALGETGFCPDGFIEDDDGAGVWPIAIHNWLLKNMRREAPSQPNPWSSFRGSVQQRSVSLYDVLTVEELRTVRFARAFCLTPWVQQPRLFVDNGALQWVDLDDRLSVGLMLKDMLRVAQRTTHPDKVAGLALIETRLFDLDVTLTRLQAIKARQETSALDQALRAAGVTPGGRFELAQRRQAAFGSSPAAVLWRTAMGWPASEWLSLREDRRNSLFADADSGLAGVVDATVRDALVIDIADALLDQKNGAGVARWLGFAAPPQASPPSQATPAQATDDVTAGHAGLASRTGRLQEALYAGARGERLLGLDVATGFRERSAIALHRGVDAVKAGETLAALRSFAFALAHADESSDPEGMHRLCRRWLAFVLSQYATTDEVIGIVEAFVPAADYAVVVDSLLWRAAFHQDMASFDGVCASAKRRKAGTVGRMCTQLEPLARGEPVALWAAVESGAGGGAGAVRFAERLLDELSTEPLDVRHNQRQNLQLMLRVFDDAAVGSATTAKKIEVLRRRVQGLLDGIEAFDDSVRGRVAAAAPDGEAYVGSVRLAPADPLPWPFPRPAATPPNPFLPIQLRPVERSTEGATVSAWTLAE